MTRKELKLKAKASLSGNWGTAIGTLLLLMAISFVAAYIPFGAFIVAGPIGVGCAFMFTSMLRGKKINVGDGFEGFKNFGNACITGVLMNVYIMLWTLLFIIPGYVKSYSYAMTCYILADNPDMKANDAITKSREMMDGHKMELFLLHLSFIGWMILGAFTFGVLYIWLIPYMDATTAAFYESIKGESQPNVVEGEEEPAIAMLEE